MRTRNLRKLLRRFAVGWAVAFAALLGVTSGVAQLFPTLASGLRSAISLLGASVVLAAVYAWHRSAPQHLPLSEVLPDQLASSPSLSIECTTDRAPLLAVHRLTEDVYPGVEPLSSERYEQWLMVNPNIFVCLFDATRNVLGYFDVFPLRGDFLQLLVEGAVGEQDIRREHFLTPAEAGSASGLYLGGVAVSDWHCHHGKRCAAMMVWGLLKYLDHFYPEPPDRTLYAHAVTAEGERLLQRFRFQRLADPEGRRDPYPLYAAPLDDAFRDLVRANVPEFSPMVRVGWQHHERPRMRVVRGRVA
jgi:hypothetical protein